MRAPIARFVIPVVALGALCGVGSVLPALAQTRPPNLQPVPEPPPPPKGYELDGKFEPEITTVRRGNETVEEYRMGGRLYMMKVTPAGGGTPYYLIDNNGDGKFARQESHDTGLRPPMWLIHSF